LTNRRFPPTLPPEPMRAWKRFGQQDGDLAATWHNVLVHIQKGPTSPRSVPNLTAAASSILLKHKSFVFLIIVEPQATPPDQSARKQLTDFFETFRDSIARSIVIPEGDGFRSSIVRGVGTAVSLLAPKSFTFSFCGSVEEASAKLRDVLQPVGGAAPLIQALSEMRAAK
jgi:hypothetical protein